MYELDIVPLSHEYRHWAADIIQEHWGSTEVVTRGRIHQADELPGFVAVADGKPLGLVTYRIEGSTCEIITLNSLDEGLGIGTKLVEAARRAASAAGCKRLWLITTNDNVAALRFYQKRGFHLAAIHCNAIEKSRRIKPQIPLVGMHGIPIRDEIELELWMR